MPKLDSIKIDRRQLTIYSISIIALANFDIVVSEGTINDNSSSCNPANCKTVCTPNCNADEACVLRTMSECGVCPNSICVSRTVLNLPPIPTASKADTTRVSSTALKPTTSNNKSSSAATAAASTSTTDTGVLVGGIVGGLVSFGLLLAFCLFLYFRHNKKKRRYGTKTGRAGGGGLLPFLNNGSHVLGSKEKSYHNQQQLQMQKEQQQLTTPHPTVLAALAHQYRSSYSTSNPKEQIVESITDDNNNNVKSNGTAKKDGAIRRKSSMKAGETLQRKVALQNKRISEILNDNPRLVSTAVQQNGKHHHLHQPVVLTDDNRHSVSSSMISTDDESDIEEQQQQIAKRRSAAYNLPYQKPTNMNTTASTTNIVQAAAVVTRAKPQIMRVNSVRSTNTTNSTSSGGLSRNGSVRTILTPYDPPIVNSLTRSASSRTAATNKSDKSLNSGNNLLLYRSASVRSTATNQVVSTTMVSSTAPELTSAKPFNKKQLHRSVSVRSTLSEVIFVSRSSSVKSTNNDTLTSDASITDQHNLSLPDGDISGNQQQSINKHSNFHATNTRQDAKDDDQSIDHFITTFDSHPLQAYDVARTLANPFHDTQTSFRTANEDWSKNP